MSDSSTDVAYLTRALKMPRAREVASSLAEAARAEGWDYLEFLSKLLSEEVASGDTHGGENRVKAARFPQTKTLDDFDFSHQRSVSRQQISHLHQLDFLREANNVTFLGPPGTGKLGNPAWRRQCRPPSGIWVNPRAEDDPTLRCPNTTIAERELEWQAEVSLRDGPVRIVLSAQNAGDRPEGL